jgi:PAS domain S-box-containing protein
MNQVKPDATDAVNNRLPGVEQELRESEERYRRLFAQVPDCVFVHIDGRIVLINQAGLALYGASTHEQMIGRAVADLAHPDDRAVVAQRVDDVGRRRIELPLRQLRNLRLDGATIEVEVKSIPFEYQGRNAALTLIRDVTEQKVAERRVGRLATLYATLSKTNEAMMRIGDADVLCAGICRIIVEQGGVVSAVVRTLDASGTVLATRASAGRIGGWLGERSLSIHDPHAVSARCVRDNRAFIIDSNDDPRAAHAAADAERLGVHSAGVFPLVVEGVVHGALSVYAGEERFFDSEHEALFASLAGNLAFALDKLAAAGALQRSEARYRALFDSSPDAIRVVCDERVVMINPAGVRLFGLARADDMLGMPHCESIRADHRERARARTRGVIGQRLFMPPDYAVILRADGGEVEVEMAAMPIDFEGKPAAQVIFHDITEILAAERAIRRLNGELEERVRLRTAELERSNRDLESFSYSVAHDLRAPLRAINGFTSILKETLGDNLDDDTRTLIRRIVGSTRSMDLLIDGLLSLARLGSVRPVMVDVDLSLLAAGVAADLQAADPARAVDFVLAAGLRAVADPLLMRDALVNLIGNAWKFSSTRVRARIEFGVTATDGEAVFFVRDNGVGFDPAYKGRLFESFHRLHSADRFPGTGIGLATVKRIIAHHGGRLWAEGAVDQGATFYFTLHGVALPGAS